MDRCRRQLSALVCSRAANPPPGSYFCYDGPGALQNDLKRDMEINTSQYSQLYAWYSWPNVVLSMVGGFLIDR